MEELDLSAADILAADMPSWFVLTLAFVFGAAWGSFFNVAIYRWPREMSVTSPPSHCPGCGTQIPWWHNVPIVGYLRLGGKAACCGVPLSPRYPIVELLGAIVCVALASQFVVHAPFGRTLLEGSLLTFCYFAFAGGLIVAAFVDLAHMEIPDEVSLPGAALGLATAAWRDPPGAADAALGAGLGFLLVYVVFVWGYEQLSGRRGMGEGDAKLLLMIGAFLGWQGVLFSLFAGAMQGLVAAGVAFASGVPLGPSEEDLDAESNGEEINDSKDSDGEALPDERPRGPLGTAQHPDDSEPPPRWVGHLKLPFGPFLSLAALEYLFFGQVLADRWLDLMGNLFGDLSG